MLFISVQCNNTDATILAFLPKEVTLFNLSAIVILEHFGYKKENVLHDNYCTTVVKTKE